MPTSHLRVFVLVFALFVSATSGIAASISNLRTSPVPADAISSLPPRRSVTETWAIPPPQPVFGDAVLASGQAHLMVASHTAPRELTLHSYHTITKVWAVVGTVELPGEPLVLHPAQDGFLVETEGASELTRILIEKSRSLLKPLDWVVIAGYMAAMAGIGWWCYRQERKQSTADYFLAGRNIPWWAAGLSLYATGTSAVSFIAIPAKSFATDWVYLAQNFVGIVGTIYVAFKIIPLIRRLGLTSVYHYLEMRFHPSVRVMSSALCIVFQLAGRMSIVLFLPALAIAGVTGASVVWIIILMGIVTTVYTVMGGMKAVIWTDVIQVFVMMGGAIFAIGYVIHGIDGGLTGFFQIASEDAKLHTFDLTLDLTLPTIWAFLLLEVVNVATWPKDQVMMQRVLATRNDREARSSVLALAGVVIPGSILFYAIGTALFAFYKTHPERLNPLLEIDATFPLFIAAELPMGITGLIIAGLFAASMSTLSSGINSVATLTSVDFYERFTRNSTTKGSVRLAEWVTVLAGAIGTGCAVLLSFFDIKSLFDVSLQLAAVLGGGFAGTYALGMFTRRSNWQGALIGTALSIACAFLLRPVMSPILLPGVSVAACIVGGYIASHFFPPPGQSLAGLTIYTPRRQPAPAAPLS